MEDVAEVTVADDGDTALVTVAGDLTHFTCSQLSEAVEALVAGRRPVAVDLGAVGFMDSSGLACLLRLAHRTRADGLAWSLVALSPMADQLIERTGTRSLLAGATIDR